MAIEPEYNYCPQCGGEYRADIRKCADCGVALVGGAELLARQASRLQQQQDRSREIDPAEAAVTVRKGPIQSMKALQAYLRDHGLPSRVAKEDGGACGCRGPEVLLQVREGDLDDVLAALAREYRQNTGLAEHHCDFAGAVYDTEAAEAVCPACGCRFATTVSECPDCGLCFA